MEPKFQTSFIPKKQVGGDSDRVSFSAEGVNIFTFGATLIFIATIAVYGGLFFYKSYLINKQVESDKALNDARTAIEPEKIQDILDANSRITSSLELLERHLVTTNFLNLLGDSTVKNLKLNDLVYQNKNGVPSLIVSGEVGSYNALAYQEMVLRQNEFLKDISFSEINLGETGSIRFKLESRINPDVVSYKKIIDTQNPTGSTDSTDVSGDSGVSDLESENLNP